VAIISATQIRAGMVLVIDGQPHRVMHFRHSVQGRNPSVIPVKLRNLLSGTQVEARYRADNKVEETEVDIAGMEYLYRDGDEFVFMDTSTYEQISILREKIDDITGYLLPNTVCKVQLYQGTPIGIIPPNTVQMKVEETEPVIKGATASGNVTKPATLESGLVVQVPMFIAEGDTVIIHTPTGEYQGRPGR
jgi:elongation factor P